MQTIVVGLYKHDKVEINQIEYMRIKMFFLCNINVFYSLDHA